MNVDQARLHAALSNCAYAFAAISGGIATSAQCREWIDVFGNLCGLLGCWMRDHPKACERAIDDAVATQVAKIELRCDRDTASFIVNSPLVLALGAIERGLERARRGHLGPWLEPDGAERVSAYRTMTEKCVDVGFVQLAQIVVEGCAAMGVGPALVAGGTNGGSDGRPETWGDGQHNSVAAQGKI